MDIDDELPCDNCGLEFEELWFCAKINQHLCIECYEKGMNP